MKTKIILFMMALVLPASAVKFLWDAPVDASVVGYRIYWGTVIGRQTNSVTFGKVTTGIINNADLLPNRTYFFSIKSRDAAGVESVAADSLVSWETPPAPALPVPVTNRVYVVTVTITNGTFGVRTN